jgi:hypothetical protein
MPDLNYKITTAADLEGSQRAGESLDKLNQTAGAAKKGLAGAGEATEGLNVKGRELYRIAGMIDRIIPGAGDAIRAFGKRNDQTALAVTGVAAALEIVLITYKKIADGAKAADEAIATLLTEGGSKAAIEAMRKAWEDADIASTVYHYNLFRDEDDAVKRIADTNIEIAKRFQTAQEQINNAQKGVAEASIEAMEKNGVISHEEALKRKYELDVEYENKRLALMRQTDARILDIQRGELAAKIGQKGAADSNEAAAAAANKIAQGTLAKHETLAKTYGENISKAQETIKQTGITPELVQKLNEAFSKITGKNDVTTGLAEQYDALKGLNLLAHPSIIPLMDKLGARGGEAGLAAYGTGRQDIKSNQASLDAENKRDEALRTTAEIAKSDLAEANRVQTELKKSINDLSIKVGELAATNKANETNAATVAGLNKQAEAIKSGVASPASTDIPPPTAAGTQPPFLPAGTSAGAGRTPFEQTDEGKARAAYTSFNDSAEAIRGGGKLFDDQRQRLDQLEQMLFGHKVTDAKLIEFLNKMDQNREIRDRVLDQLIQKVNQATTLAIRAQNSADLH